MPITTVDDLRAHLVLVMRVELATIPLYLMERPIGGGLAAGPCFEVVDLGSDPDATLRELGARAVEGHPALADVVARL